ncbi:MAG: hypothetical protein ACI8YQ_001791 [Polaribacter sp.]|jgi:hypothetical protein
MMNRVSENLSEVPDDYFLSETDPNGIEDRLNYSNDVVRWKSTNPFTSGEADTDIYWLHVADVAPFVLFGKTLSATHIDFLDNKAYISYHTRGDEHLGALEVVDLSGFYSTHKSHLINTELISKYLKEGLVVMVDAANVPVARRKKEEFVEQVLNGYLLN